VFVRQPLAFPLSVIRHPRTPDSSQAPANWHEAAVPGDATARELPLAETVQRRPGGPARSACPHQLVTELAGHACAWAASTGWWGDVAPPRPRLACHSQQETEMYCVTGGAEAKPHLSNLDRITPFVFDRTSAY